MKIKTSFILFVLLVLFYQFPIMQSPAQQNSPINDFMDNRWEGLFAGGGFRYGTVRISDEDAAYGLGGTSGVVEWRIGYATSDDLAFYITSPIRDFTPQFGVMAFIQGYPGYYYSGRIGYLNREVNTEWVEEKVDGWSLNAGVGYEFRKHLTVELMGGYGWFGFEEADYELEITSFFASFNYFFY